MIYHEDKLLQSMTFGETAANAILQHKSELLKEYEDLRNNSNQLCSNKHAKYNTFHIDSKVVEWLNTSRSLYIPVSGPMMFLISSNHLIAD